MMGCVPPSEKSAHNEIQASRWGLNASRGLGGKTGRSRESLKTESDSRFSSPCRWTGARAVGIENCFQGQILADIGSVSAFAVTDSDTVSRPGPLQSSQFGCRRDHESLRARRLAS